MLGHLGSRSIGLSVALLLGACLVADSAPLAVVNSLSDIWGDVALQAAEVTVQAIQKQTGLSFSLRDVPLDSFQLYIGRQHHLSVEMDGKQYDLLLNDQSFGDDDEDPAAPKGSSSSMSQRHLPGSPKVLELPGSASITASSSSSSSGSGSSMPFDPFQWQRQRIQLPEITLMGPVELVLSHPTPLTLFLPHSAEVPAAQRLLVGPSVALTLRQLRGISLRRPVELGTLPPSYLAQVHASARLGEPEPGYEGSPGMLYLANELYRAATNASLGIDGKARMLLSFELEPAAPSVTIISAVLPGEAKPRSLRAKRLSDGTLDISLRSAEELEAATAAVRAAAAEPDSSSGGGGRSCGMSPGALAPAAWAWPFPLMAMQDWVTYENLLRGLLGSVPLRKALAEGVGLKLKRSSIKGVSLIKFDMQLRGGLDPMDELKMLPGRVVDQEQLSVEPASLEVWEAVVQVKESKAKDSGAEFVPLSVKRKHAYHSTVTLTPGGWANLLGQRNKTTPIGTEPYDAGYRP